MKTTNETGATEAMRWNEAMNKRWQIKFYRKYREKERWKTEQSRMECKAYASIIFWINHIEIKVNDKNYCLCELYEFFIFIELILSSVSKFYRCHCWCCHCCCRRHHVSTHTFLPFAQYFFSRLAFFATHFSSTKFGTIFFPCSMPSSIFFLSFLVLNFVALALDVVVVFSVVPLLSRIRQILLNQICLMS